MDKSENQEIVKEAKEKFGIDLSGMDISALVQPESIESGIVDLLMERAKKVSCDVEEIMVRCHLEPSRIGKKMRVRFKTFYVKDGSVKSTESVPLRRYTAVDMMSGGMISGLFRDILVQLSVGYQIESDAIFLSFTAVKEVVAQNPETDEKKSIYKLKLEAVNAEKQELLEEISIIDIFSTVN